MNNDLELLKTLKEAIGDCPHQETIKDEFGSDRRHWFKFADGPRNVWNPFEPKCEKCGKSIGYILNKIHDVLYPNTKRSAEL